MSMAAKEWLGRARKLRLRLSALEDSKQRSYARAVSSTAGLGERVSGGEPGDKLAAYAEVSLAADRQIEKLEQTRAEILQVIGQVEDNTLAALLIEYYVNDKTWKEVASQIQHSVRQTMRLHGQALCKVREITGLE
ncbi:MAG TPA: hypothetical protein H9832_05335 [Candidatus Agathobaculum merdavium]|nr:hypothetical protein [Candidatus Agathobaculum merdavium]